MNTIEPATPGIIETEQVRLRRDRESDAEDLVAGFDDPLIRRFMPALPAPYTRADAASWITEGAPATWAAGGASYVIADPVTDRLLGGIGLSQVVPTRQQGEIGYWLAPWARGRGLAGSAVTALATHALGERLARLELVAHLDNTASQRVALAAGFQPEGVRRGGGSGPDGTRYDLLVFARLADDPPGPAPRLLPDLPGGQLTDGVVTLRPLTTEDADFIHELHSQPDVVATSVPPVAPRRADTVTRCTRAASQWLLGKRADLVILDAAGDTPAGEIGFFYQEPQTGKGMIGYSMHPAFRGRGYPTRAVRLLARWAFGQAGVERLEAGTLPENLASQRVLIKAGFQREGYQRGRLPGMPVGTRNDDVLFGLLPADLE